MFFFYFLVVYFFFLLISFVFCKILFGVVLVLVVFVMGFCILVDYFFFGFFVLCGLMRLVWFNVIVVVIFKDVIGKVKYFEGIFIFIMLVIDVVMVYWIFKGWIYEVLFLGILFMGIFLEFYLVVFMFVIYGCLMCSKMIYIFKF